MSSLTESSPPASAGNAMDAPSRAAAAPMPETKPSSASSSSRVAAEGGDGANWMPIETAPRDGTMVWVYTAAREGLRSFQGPCAYHPDAGWCTDELREVTHWVPLSAVYLSPPSPMAVDAGASGCGVIPSVVSPPAAAGPSPVAAGVSEGRTT